MLYGQKKGLKIDFTQKKLTKRRSKKIYHLKTQKKATSKKRRSKNFTQEISSAHISYHPTASCNKKVFRPNLPDLIYQANKIAQWGCNLSHITDC